MLAAADLVLVTLNAGASLSSLPSKIFNGMASARPILAVAPLESQLAQIVDQAVCGWTVPPGARVELASTIDRLRNQETALLQRAQNGRAYLEKYYSRKQCVAAYEKMLLNLCEQFQWKPATVGGNK